MSHIEQIPLHLFAEDAMRDYIKETVTSRALADAKDGLKPVQRKILWAMFKLGLFHNLAHKKSAKVSGEVMAKYNPHADCYPAIVNLAQAQKKYNFVDGQGNWGGYSGDSPAASRYTECRLSKLAEDCLLDKDYLKVIPYEDNYDGTEKEPVYLPARLPFALLNGVQGIAAAVRTGLPCFEMASLIDRCIYFLKHKELPIEEALKIKFTTIYGGKCISPEEDIRVFLETGNGSILFEPTYIIYKDRIELVGLQDNFDFDKTIEKLEELSEVKNVKDEGTGNIKICIYLNCKYNDTKAIDKIRKVLQTRMLYTTTILNRLPKEDGSVNANYKETTILKVITNWCKFRVMLEKRYLQYLIQEQEKNIKYQELLLKASKNLKIIFDALKEENTEEVIIDRLQVTKEEAKIILDLPVRRLSKLDSSKTEDLLCKYKENLKDLQNRLNNPIDEVIKDLEKLKKEFA